MPALDLYRQKGNARNESQVIYKYTDDAEWWYTSKRNQSMQTEMK